MAETILFKDEIYEIAGAAMSVLNHLGHGFNEKVYENALAIELKNKNISFQKQKPYEIFYRNELVGTYIPDFVVENKIILELKTIENITNHEKGQVIHYLKTTHLSLGLILNFKHAKLEWQAANSAGKSFVLICVY